ncbi:MAG: hypothetical protein FJ167_03040 [Gammaproteobacteria bacterium]|nr:hypothetical protein [Gammaproteobacteria bacterium]
MFNGSAQMLNPASSYISGTVKDGTTDQGDGAMPKDSTPPATRGRRLLTFKQFLDMKKRMESVPPSPPALSRRTAERDSDAVPGAKAKASS